MTNSQPDSARGETLPARFAERLHARYPGKIAAIVMYGSWLRGKRDTVLDFYVLLDDYQAFDRRALGWGNRLLAPNVFQLSFEDGEITHAAKYATISLEHFERSIAGDFHSYFWARFAQPSVIVNARDEATRQSLERSCERAAWRMISETRPLMESTFSSEALWTRALQLTYGCELRSEDHHRAQELARAYRDHFAQLTTKLAAECELQAWSGDWRHGASATAKRACERRWKRRAMVGKFLSAARLLKAALTFNQPLEYVLWKVERHSGIKERASPMQHRYPLLFAWPVLWRIYKRGGFR